MSEISVVDEANFPSKEKLQSRSQKSLELSPGGRDGSSDAPVPDIPVPDTSDSDRPEGPVPYTIFTHNDKRLIASVLVFTMLASPLTATIYLPLLPLLAAQFHVSLQSINLTITIYIVFQAVSPLLFATASDSYGRRPIYLITFAVYTVASLGLALNKHSYVGLLILRALQSLGASAVLAIAFGVVADVCPPAGRGAMLGPTQGAANLAVCLGPVIGGWIALASRGSAWVFWALMLFGALVLIVVGIALPETARNVVGNGSLEATGWSRSWLMMIKFGLRSGFKSNEIKMDEGRFGHRKNQNVSNTNGPATLQKKRFKMIKPWAALRIIFYKDTALVLWMAASPYAVWYCVQASIPPIYQNIYAFNEIQIGLSYLTGGLGTVLGGYANGRLMDWNYQIIARQVGHTIDRLSGDDLENFPIERARSRGAWVLLLGYIGALTGYGWSVNAHAHESVPLILQFLLAAFCTSFQQTFNALLVDIFPKSPSTAAASSNITRCLLSAAAVAVVQPLSRSIGRSWFFTSLALLSGGGGLAADWSLKKYGMQWRRERIAKAKQSESHNATTQANHDMYPEARPITDEKSESGPKVCHLMLMANFVMGLMSTVSREAKDSMWKSS